ncbi:N-acetylglucosamine/diacetylchitobiose ABC transporter substrate-binding protein [Tenggerimyces flavus]|uniref:N-acetylglucosamine/diacetylchitobiose ABC transporter substrate-binding protein n=1 Tax=Tenggerimyces flavus TaxID=1708749 RepID=A0ABV7Y6J1_9ACTN|nr:N-acetylglucosamine/diacetylchitobiose ABC transporter substrate-binding protein [Tenggerimyces flavus]MBM7785333.1 N-acetylglucosamine transport system substrate-binding protein [Tenggerimyces flavus]
MSEDQVSSRLGRRGFLGSAATLGAVAGSPALLAACATGGGGTPTGTENKPTPAVSESADNPFGVDPKAPLDVVIFKGGFSDEYAKYHQTMYKKRFPDAAVKHTGTQDITPQLQPRFVQGSPPDVVDNSGAQALDTTTLATTGQLTVIDDRFLDAPSLDFEGKKIRDTLVDGALDQLTIEGKVYGLPYALNINGIWHNAALFEKNGWEPAKTWDDLMALGVKTKAADLPLWTYQGQYPNYMVTVFAAMVTKHGGNDVMKNIDNLEDGAWSQDAVKAVAEAFFELKSKGYIMRGTASLTHVQAQAQWASGKAAIIPCGSWLKSELGSQLPADFKMAITPTPSLDAGDKLGYEAIPYGTTESFVVPSKGKNVNGGLEYLRTMLSKEAAQKFAELTYTLTVVKGAHDDQDVDTVLKSSLDAYDAAQAAERIQPWRYTGWYVPMKDDIEGAMGQLLTGNLDANGFVARAQKVADRVKKDPKIKKLSR